MDYRTDRDEKDYNFAHFLAIVRDRWWAVILTIVVLGGLAFGASLLFSPRYRAEADLAYSPDDAQLASQALSSVGTTGLTHNIANDALTVSTSTFAKRVREALGSNMSAADLRSSVRVSWDSELDIIKIAASGSDPLLVADVANTFATEFVKQRQEEAAASLAAANELLETRINSLTTSEAESAYGIAIKQRHDDLAVLLSMEIKDYTVLQEAIVPASPYFPRPFLNLELALVVGLVLGLALAVLLDHLDRRIKDQSTLERVMDLPIIGTVALARGRWVRSGASGNPAVGFREGNEALLESMRMLRSSLKVLGFGDTKRSVLITSVAPAEGKTTLAVNLALSMALAGDRVVLVDADFRNPSIHRYLNLPNTTGLGDVLLEKDNSWSSKVQAVELGRYVVPRMGLARKAVGKETAVSKFLCLTSGLALSNPSEILESGAMTDMVDELQGISDYVILDGPPLLIASDSLILAQSVDAVIFASRMGRETAAEALQAKQILARAEISALGIVVCGSKPQAHDAYHYYRSDQHAGTPARKNM